MFSKFPRSMPCITLAVCLLLLLSLAPRISTRPLSESMEAEEVKETEFIIESSLPEEGMDIIKRQVERTIDQEYEVEDLEDSEDSCNFLVEEPDQSFLWPNGEIPFSYDIELSNGYREIFREAMNHWMEATCIKFVDRRMSDANYVVFKAVSQSGDATCSSPIGRQGGEQIVQLSGHCSGAGHAIHELGHAIGLYHEHSRRDRDRYITIHRNNIQNQINYVEDFEIIDRDTSDKYPNLGYDIQSIMHYGEYAASIEGGVRKTITLNENANLTELQCSNRLPMGQRRELSYKDKRRVNCLYNCNINVSKPECIIPTPTPTTVSPSSTTETASSFEMPTPSTTLPSVDITPAPLSRKLRSGNVIALTLADKNEAIGCTPSCIPKPCTVFSCKNEDNQFEIIKANRSATPRIESGNTVLLRSVKFESKFLDCSDSRRCTISTCNEDNLNEDISNSSYISNCARHQFQIFGYSKNKGALKTSLTTNHQLQFKEHDSSKLMDCRGKFCKMDDGSCPPENITKSICTLQSFTALKLSEDY